MNKIEKIYIITIERSKIFRLENLKRLKSQLLDMNGFKGDIEEVGVDCNHIYDNPNRIRELQINKILCKSNQWFRTGGGRGRVFQRGEIGCFLSHHAVWLDIVKNNIKHALVFEDDSKIEPEVFYKQIENIMNNLPQNGRYISLYHSPQKESIKNAKNVNKFIKLVKFDLWGTVSYIISLETAREFTQKLVPIYAPVDRAIASYCRSRNYIYISNVNLVELCDDKSIIR